MNSPGHIMIFMLYLLKRRWRSNIMLSVIVTALVIVIVVLVLAYHQPDD